MGEVVPLFPKDRRARKRGNIPPPPLHWGFIQHTFPIPRHEVPEKYIAERLAEYMEQEGVGEDDVLQAGFLEQEGEA
jgi:hypothetical protein